MPVASVGVLLLGLEGLPLAAPRLVAPRGMLLKRAIGSKPSHHVVVVSCIVCVVSVSILLR